MNVIYTRVWGVLQMCDFLMRKHTSPVGVDDTGKGLSRPQPLQAAGFDDLVTTRNVTLFSCLAGEVGH